MENVLLTDDLLRFFKALSDVNRLKILGLLAQQSLSVEQLAEMLNLRPSTVSHHLARLSEAGLVSARASSYYNLYQLETKALEDMAQRLLAKETLPAVASDVDLDAYDRKVVKDYTLPDGHLTSIPTQRKKLDAVLHYIVESFEPGSHFTEKQVNEILARYHQDTAFLRRELIDAHLLASDKSGRDYWRVQD